MCLTACSADPESAEQDPDQSATGGAESETSESSGAAESSPDDVPIDSRKPDDGEPGAPDRKGRQADVFERVEGSAGPGCVEVGGGRDIRAGQFVAGPFDDAVKLYGQSAPEGTGPNVNLYFVPLHAAKMQKLSLEALGPDGQSGKLASVGQASTGDWRFYDASLELPQGGRWTIRVSAGVDRGCFVVDLPS